MSDLREVMHFRIRATLAREEARRAWEFARQAAEHLEHVRRIRYALDPTAERFTSAVTEQANARSVQ